MTLTNIGAIIFDMDGTLVDSELLTEKAIRELLELHGISHQEFDCTQCYGVTWKAIEELLCNTFPQLAGRNLATPLQESFHAMGLQLKPAPIPGAQWAVEAAHQNAKTAIGTSGNQESVTEVVERLELKDILTTTVSVESYQNSKPAPDCYLLVSKRLNVAPPNCLVFEDSIPGIQAAKAAGMKVVAITHRSTDPKLAAKLADKAIENYQELPKDFFSKICND